MLTTTLTPQEFRKHLLQQLSFETTPSLFVLAVSVLFWWQCFHLQRVSDVNNSVRLCPCRPQPYRSLKEAELIEGVEPIFGAECHTAPPSPVNEKFSNVNLLGDIFGCQDEPDSQPITLAKSLEDLRTPKDCCELQTKFTYQVRLYSFTNIDKTFKHFILHHC